MWYHEYALGIIVSFNFIKPRLKRSTPFNNTVSRFSAISS
jgi:hypothetical protein